MDIEADIKWIRAELMNVKDPHLIEVFKNLLKYRKKKVQTDWWDEISDEEKAEINEGIYQADKGELISHNEMKKSYSKWL